MTATAVLPAPADLSGGEGLYHYVCCDDDNTALCGLDVTEYEWKPADTEPKCVVCADLADGLCRDVCPLRR